MLNMHRVGNETISKLKLKPCLESQEGRKRSRRKAEKRGARKGLNIKSTDARGEADEEVE